MTLLSDEALWTIAREQMAENKTGAYANAHGCKC